MNHVVCVPLVAGFPFETLSYVSKKHYTIGDIVPITIGRQHQVGCIISCEDIRAHKLDIKSRDYITKTMSAESIGHLPEEMISWFFRVAQEELEPYMNIWKGFLTNNVLEFLLEEAFPKSFSSYEETSPGLIIGGSAERIRYYCENYFIPHMEKSESVLIISPTNDTAKALFHEIASCDVPTLLVTKSLPKKTKESLKKLGEEPAVVVSTPQNFLAAVRSVQRMIIDDAASPSYKSTLRPRINLEHALSLWSEETNMPLVVGATIPSVDLFARIRHRNGSLITLPNETLVPLSCSTLESDHQKKLDAFWKHFSHTIQSAQSQGKTSCIIAPGNALARRVVCRDCGSYVTCPRCTSITELHDTPKRHFWCRICSHEFPVRDQCKLCSGTSLEMFGIGVSFIAETLKGSIENIIIQTKDHSIPSPLPLGAVIIGNRSLLYTLPDKAVDHVWLITPDTILVSPPYDAHEHIMRVYKEAESKARACVHSITRTDLNWLAPILRDNEKLTDFLKEELSIRKQTDLPPFGTWILLAGYIHKKDYSALWKFLHEESPNYLSLVPRWNYRESGLDEKLSEKKKSYEIPFTLVHATRDTNTLEEKLLARFRMCIIARTKNPTYVDKEEPHLAHPLAPEEPLC